MDLQEIALPQGFRLATYPELDSTNAEAMRLANGDEPGGLWICALGQTAGRGRYGRTWQSFSGNLFASLLLRPGCEAGTASQLGFVGALAVCDTAFALAEDTTVDIKLKWPNDLLLDGMKAGGILLQSTTDTSGALAVVIGVGLNLAKHPENTDYPATDFAIHGLTADPARALQHLAKACAQWLSVWDSGEGFSHIRGSWAERTLPVGSALEVRLAGEQINGLFQGIDEDGALILKEAEGIERRITTGDIFPL